MSFYDELAATAEELLAEFGAAATLSRSTPGAYDPATGTDTPATTTTQCRAAVFDYATRLVDGTLVRQGDRQAFVSVLGLTFEPQPSDTMLWGGVTYTVVRVTQTAPSGQAVLYELQVRRG